MAGAPKVIFLSGQLRGQAFELAKDEYTIGRTEDCGICIPDPTVSSAHATLVRTDDGAYEARDEGSPTGTRINGVRIDQAGQRLAHNDILQVGDVEVLYHSPGSDLDFSDLNW